MASAPCKECENKGCGSYHDQCPIYQAYVAEIKRVRDNQAQARINGRNYYIGDRAFRSRKSKYSVFKDHRK